ncbi:hypothetical protein C8A00DRAFT_38006 [Chaetomidium leptoderma]|uniref:Uncharacterized protein n=1 Tax=Chaetomidium leptoderma TaxID=669021 RepID=A0AAN6VDI8_9PEZI|nr:hypothetical protein C8A00DRAFT_38006 [Chaetomidium leptoderma]
MKATNLYLALGAAQLALCAPVPGVAAAPRTWSPYLTQNDAPEPDRRDPSKLPQPKLIHPADGERIHPLSKHRNQGDRIPKTEGSSGWSRERPKSDATRLPHPVHNEDDDFDLMDIAHHGVPCHQGQSLRERNDMLVVFLAVVFMAVVVVMETWGSLFQRQGAIRLQDNASQPHISIRAALDDQNGIRDEKGHM